MADEIELKLKPKRKGNSGTFKKNNPHRFQPGDERINKSGKPRDEKVLVRRSLREQLATCAPRAITELLQMPENSSWGACIAARLLRLSFHPNEVLSLAAVRTITEMTEGKLESSALIDEMNGEANGVRAERLHVHFMPSNGAGGLSEDSKRRMKEIEARTANGEEYGVDFTEADLAANTIEATPESPRRNRALRLGPSN